MVEYEDFVGTWFPGSPSLSQPDDDFPVIVNRHNRDREREHREKQTEQRGNLSISKVMFSTDNIFSTKSAQNQIVNTPQLLGPRYCVWSV